MNCQRIIVLVCHAVACLLFPVVSSLGFQGYIAFIGTPLARGASLGLAVQLIFIAFALTNALIAFASSMKAKVSLCCVQTIAVIVYLLPENPLRTLFYGSLSSALSFAAIYAKKRLTPPRTET